MAGEILHQPEADHPLDEQLWSLFARASAATGVRSSLSVPLIHEGSVVGGLNLYAATYTAFDGHHEALASLVGADAADAVRDADLSFSTRQLAADAPRVLADQADVDVAVGIIVARHAVDPETARRQLSDAAAQTGCTEVEVARTLIRLRLA